MNSMVKMDTELLFFDTFSHDISEELNLDLVQFPKPVYISEVRIIPLGARVQADFPGGVRLGATNPSQFEIEFFVNDLSKPGASTFESLGGLEYKQNVHIQLECDHKQIPTDGLVLRGWYTTITLAVYGTLTKTLSNPQEISNPAASATVCVNRADENNETVPTHPAEQEKEWFYENQIPETNSTDAQASTSTPPPIPQPNTEPKPLVADATKPDQWKESSPTQKSPVKRPLSPPSESLVSLSPESISAEEDEEEPERDPEDRENIVESFEPILSDEEMLQDEIPTTEEYDNEVMQKCELFDFSPPNLLDIRKCPEPVEKLESGALEKLQDLIQSMQKTVANFNAVSGQEKENFVHNCESLCTHLFNLSLDREEFDSLSEIVNVGLDVELACSQPQPAYKVRHVKVGVRLAEALCKLDEGPSILLRVEAPKKLLVLCMRENVALPVKLSAIRALDSALISPKIVQEFLKPENELYELALLMIDSAKLARLKYALSSFLRKIHAFEILTDCRNLNLFALSELANAFSYAPTLMAQPKRQLPASTQMEFEREHKRNPRKFLIAYFSHFNLSYQLLVKLCSPDSDKQILRATRKLISQLADTKEGLLYLLKEPEITKMILKALHYDQSGLGCKLGWRLQVVQNLMCLSSEYCDWIIMRRLHAFLIHSEGLEAIVTVVPMGDFIDILIPYLSDPDLGEYASDIISAVVRFSSRVEILQSRAVELLDKAKIYAVLSNVVPHLTVAGQNCNWNYSDVSSLVGIVRKSADRAVCLPGELVMACRILYHLVFPPQDIDPMEPYMELKHKNALTQLFAADGLTALITVMANISEFYDQPNLYSAELTGQRCLTLVSLLYPVVRLVRTLLERLVKCMATDFKDLTPVGPLLGVYCLVEAVRKYCENQSVRLLSDEIVSTLLVFTRAVDSDGSGNVAKSLWTQMLGEVLKMVSLSPCNFVPGLRLLARLLPPTLSCTDTPTDDKIRVFGLRKLWSAHLQAQATNLTETLKLLCSSWNKDLLQLVSTVCKQLSDLAAPTALLVGRCLLDGVLSASPLENSLPILVLLNDLARHAPMKATLLTLTSHNSRAQVKSDQKYPPVIEMLCNTLKNADVAVQVEILGVIETLCDCTINFVQEDTNEPLEKRLTHSVPSKEPLVVILTNLIEILANASKYRCEILDNVLRILLLLTEHNYGLYHVKSCLENNPEALKCLLEHVASLQEYEKKSLTEITLAFFDSLVSSRSSERTLHLQMQQLSALVSWEKTDHPLQKLEGAENLTEQFLSSEEKEEKEPIPEMLEPLLPAPEALLNQFAQRSVKATDVSESPRKSLARLSVPKNDGTVDLLALATELLPADFNLLSEAQRLCSKVVPDDTYYLQKNERDENTRDSKKETNTHAHKIKPFVTPMSGRNQFTNSMRGGPGVAGGVGRGADPFRSRPPNTSRPPSLHVDDFVALEICGAQPTGPTGYNKLSVRGSSSSRNAIINTRSRPWVAEPRQQYLR